MLISLCTGEVRHLYCNNTLQSKATFAFHKVVWRHYACEAGVFTIFLM